MLDSRIVANIFKKSNKDAMKVIKKVVSPDSGYSEEFGRRSFALSSYKNSQSKSQPCCQMTRDRFVA